MGHFSSIFDDVGLGWPATTPASCQLGNGGKCGLARKKGKFWGQKILMKIRNWMVEKNLLRKFFTARDSFMIFMRPCAKFNFF